MRQSDSTLQAKKRVMRILFSILIFIITPLLIMMFMPQLNLIFGDFTLLGVKIANLNVPGWTIGFGVATYFVAALSIIMACSYIKHIKNNINYKASAPKKLSIAFSLAVMFFIITPLIFTTLLPQLGVILGNVEILKFNIPIIHVTGWNMGFGTLTYIIAIATILSTYTYISHMKSFPNSSYQGGGQPPHTIRRGGGGGANIHKKSGGRGDHQQMPPLHTPAPSTT